MKLIDENVQRTVDNFFLWVLVVGVVALVGMSMIRLRRRNRRLEMYWNEICSSAGSLVEEMKLLREKLEEIYGGKER